MSICCENIIDLGCFGHCDCITLPERSNSYNPTKIEFKSNGKRGFFHLALNPQEDFIRLSAKHFNENSETLFKIVEANDLQMGIVRNWYKIKVNLKFDFNELLNEHDYSTALRC
jgi:hypothetical protein